jgi:tetratricopeptide (TPR) repeat protein
MGCSAAPSAKPPAIRPTRSVTDPIAKARALLRDGRCAQAWAALERMRLEHMRNKQSGSPEIELLLAKSAVCVRRCGEATHLADRYLKQHPQSAAAHVVAGDAASCSRRYDRALGHYRRARALKDTPDVRLRVAKACYHMESYSRALATVSGDLAGTDAPSEVLILGIRAAVRIKQKAQALQWALRLAKQSGGRGREMCYVGMAHSATGDYERALECYEKALASQPGFPDARVEMTRAVSYLARRAYRANKTEQAIGYLRQGLRHDPLSFVLNRNLGLVHLTTGKPAEARVYFSKILAKVPTDFVVNRLEGRALLQLGKPADALARFNMAVNAVEKRYSGPLLSRAAAERSVAFARLGRLELAVTQLERALSEAHLGHVRQASFEANVRSNLVRARTVRAAGLLKARKARAAWAELQQTLQQSTALDADEQAIVRAIAAAAAFSTGRRARGKKLLEGVPEHLAQRVVRPYREIGDRIGVEKLVLQLPPLERLFWVPPRDWR